MAIKCNADLFRLAYVCTSTEDTRYYLNGVFVEPHPCGGVNLVATDGHRLIVIYDKDGKADAPQIVRLSKEALRACKPKGAKRGIGERRIVEADAATARIVLQPLNGERDHGEPALVATSPDPFIDGTFPVYRRVIPTIETAGEPACFNPRYVVDFAQISIDLGGAMRILSADASGPALVKFSGCDHAIGVLMPVRGNTLNEHPAFFTAKPHEVPVVVVGAFSERGNYGDAPSLYSFEISAEISPMSPPVARTITFPNRAKAARAFNRVLSGLHKRGQCLTREPIFAESKIPADMMAERKRRCMAIDDAAAAYSVANDNDLQQPWRRGNLPVPPVASDFQFTVMNLRHISEARAVADAYGAITAPVAPVSMRGRNGRRRTA